MVGEFTLLLRPVVVVIATASCIALARDVAAQTTRQSDEAADRVALGFWIGGEAVPASMDYSCSATGRLPMMRFGASLVVPMGPIEIEGRGQGHWRGEHYCVFAPLLLSPGTYTRRNPRLSSGGFTSWDLRLRWSPSDSGAWFVAAGAGWAASSKDVPYLTAGIGLRSATRGARLGMELELSAYRVPWTERTVLVSDTDVVETMNRPYEEWAPSVGLLFNIEFPVVFGAQTRGS